MDAISIDNLIQQCAAGVAPSTMAAIIKVESKGNPWAIGDNTTKLPVLPRPKSKEEAIEKAESLIKQGHNLDVGIAQINSSNLKSYKVSIRDAFDPCTNISLGSKILSNFYLKSVNKYGPGELSLFHALSAYNTGSFYRGPGYVSKILAAAGSNASISHVSWKQPYPSRTIALGKSLPSTKPSYTNRYYAPIIAFAHVESDANDMSQDQIITLAE